tara:strand:+ start:257 stop:499 length:243 start_codon:yes stop_codon:yes gene_type:complete
MQTDKDAQLDRIIKAAETLGKVLDAIEDKATFIHDEAKAFRPTVQETLKDFFEIIKDSEVFNEQRIAMISLVIGIINDFD